MKAFLHMFQKKILVNHDSISCVYSNHLKYNISFHIWGTDKLDQNEFSCVWLNCLYGEISFHNVCIHVLVQNEVSLLFD